MIGDCHECGTIAALEVYENSRFIRHICHQWTSCTSRKSKSGRMTPADYPGLNQTFKDQGMNDCNLMMPPQKSKRKKSIEKDQKYESSRSFQTPRWNFSVFVLLRVRGFFQWHNFLTQHCPEGNGPQLLAELSSLGAVVCEYACADRGGVCP
jgi:hypothetical protein